MTAAVSDLDDRQAALTHKVSANERLRVVVAMSGGVDSSVVAAVLQRQGHEVIGITLQLYDHGQAVRKGSCCAGQDVHDARRVADRISIPHYVLDYEQRFRASVMDAFAASYLAGETPIPCVTCNRTVKFQDLLLTARELGADALATGHYVERRIVPTGSGTRIALHRAADPDRDQSYFLFATTPEQLAYLRFPLGGLTKSEVRALAASLDLPVAAKPDSQDICFVPEGRYSDVIQRLKPDAMEPGDIVDLEGRVRGRHGGIARFTVGQRKGLGLNGAEPLFVVRIEAAARRIVVGPRSALGIDRLRLRDVNWLGDGARKTEAAGAVRDLQVRVRSTGELLPARLWRDQEGAWLVDLARVATVATGQAAVFYDSYDDRAEVLGGGIVAATERAAPSVAPATASAGDAPLA